MPGVVWKSKNFCLQYCASQVDILMVDSGQQGVVIGMWFYAARSHARVWLDLLLQWFGWNCYVLRVL